MYKVLAFIKAKNNITEERFRKYYEENHSKLIMSLFPWIINYKRSYLPFSPSISLGPRDGLPFDAVTEIYFENEDGLKKMLDKYQDNAVADAIASDEENFMDRSKTVFIALGEQEK